MSASDTRVRLVAEAAEAATEVFVIDGRFNLVPGGQGVGRVEVDVKPGMYKIKFKAGNATQEIHRAVTEPTEVRGTPIAIASPAPLEGTSETTMRADHAAAARGLSRKVHVTLGSGSEIFVFARDLDDSLPDKPCSDLTLHALDGSLLVTFSEVCERNDRDDPNPWIGATIALPPGGYRLRVTLPGTDAPETLEQVVMACPGWQTQVFLLRRRYPPAAAMAATPDEAARAASVEGPVRADLCRAAIFMARLGTGFDGNDPRLRLAELARQGLENARAVVPYDEMIHLLDERFPDLLLGILGGHLLLLQKERDLDLLRRIVGHLRQLLDPSGAFTHPDVEALRLLLPEEAASVAPFAVPPMLRSSAGVLVEASRTRPEIVPPGSLALRAAPHIWGDGVWLVARNVPEAGAAVAATDTAAALDRALPGIAALLPAGGNALESAETMAENKNLSPLEASLLGVLSEKARRAEPSPAAAPSTPALPASFSLEALRSGPVRGMAPPSPPPPAATPPAVLAGDLARTLGVPTAAVGEALAGLMEKLDL